MPSFAGSIIAAAALTVPFGATFDVRLETAPAAIHAGSVVGDFLVVSAPRHAAGGGVVIGLKPLALGLLPVSLPGAPEPATVEVRSTLAATARLAPPLFPSPPPLPWWPATGLIAIALLGWVLWRKLRPRPRTAPLDGLRRALTPLLDPAGWEAPLAADLLARECREFLRHVLGRPCPGMTTREVAQLTAAALRPPIGLPFTTALALADDLRFAGGYALQDRGAVVVRDVLAAAEALQQGPQASA